MNHPREQLVNVPNLLSLSRLPLAAGLFVCITYQMWFVGLLLFSVACVTDWLDGYWARRWGPLTAVGRQLDPLADKVLVCGAFIFLIPVPESQLTPWMVTVVVGRELLITGLRGVLESLGARFGADWAGKLKMVLQCAVLVAILGMLSMQQELGPDSRERLARILLGLIYAMLLVTLYSGLQYLWKGMQQLQGGK